MTGRILVAVVASVLVATAAHAQTPATPGPEEQRLGVWVGSWQGERETKAGPQGPAIKSTGKSTCEWFTGNFQVVCRGENTGPKGEKTSELEMGSYDHAKNVYRWYWISSDGDSGAATGTVSGSTWTWTFDREAQGKPTKTRITYDVAPTSQTAKLEVSPDGTTWTVVGEAKATKVK